MALQGEVVGELGAEQARMLPTTSLITHTPSVGLLWLCRNTWGFYGWPQQTECPASIQGLASKIVTSAQI